MGQARLPQHLHDAQTVVDHRVGDLGFAQLDGAGEELGDQQVLPLGGQLDKPNGVGLGSPASRHSRRA
jgi:hypothetical protein